MLYIEKELIIKYIYAEYICPYLYTYLYIHVVLVILWSTPINITPASSKYRKNGRFVFCSKDSSRKMLTKPHIHIFCCICCFDEAFTAVRVLPPNNTYLWRSRDFILCTAKAATVITRVIWWWWEYVCVTLLFQNDRFRCTM
jgi:hypothetical protein